MPKSRFSSTDVKSMAKDVLRVCEGRRVVNIYDLSDKCYLIKFVAIGGLDKSFLLLESGVRFHRTKYTRSQPQAPSPFAMILRRYLRTKRLERVDQLGMDRVVDFKFGSGESASHLILELYSSGNIVLTDCNYEVIALLRSHQFSDELVLKVGEIYPVACCANLVVLHNSSTELTQINTPVAFIDWLQDQNKRFEEQKIVHQENASGKAGKSKKAAQEATKSAFLKQLLLNKASCVSYLGPDIIDHCMLTAGIDTNVRMSQVHSIESSLILEFLGALRGAVASLLDSLDEPGPGYIITSPSSLPLATVQDDMIDFTPKLFKQHEGKKYSEFESFSEAVDEYYHRIEQQKEVKDQQSRILAAEKKLDKVVKDQQRTLDSLVQQQSYFQDCAMLLETYAEEVDKVLLVINSALGAAMAWPDVEAMVEIEQKRGNPLAQRISRMNLEKDTIYLKFDASESSLGFSSDDEDDTEGKAATGNQMDKVVEIELDIGLSAYANASKFYCNKKAAQVREVKTVQVNCKVLGQVQDQVKKAAVKPSKSTGVTTKEQRTACWYEKFRWFVTSEGFLVVLSKDQQQNVQGALPCIVLARKQHVSADDGDEAASAQLRVTPLAIQEAAVAVVCYSSAWNAKLLISAYWVKAEQVSKHDPTGYLLPIGSFAIRGKKNFLPPMPLEMGFGMMYCLDAESALRHLKERKLRNYDCADTESLSSTAMDRFEKYNLAFRVEEEVQEVDEVGEVDEAVSGPEDAASIVEVAGDAEVVVVTVEKNSMNDVQEVVQDSDDKSCEEEAAEGAQMEDEVCTRDSDHEELATTKKQHRSQPVENQPDRQIGATTTGKKKLLSKKKARRYAEQDQEDVELAMMVLGHASKTGKSLASLKEEKDEQKKKTDLKVRQNKAGVTQLKGDWKHLMELFSEEVRIAMQQLVDAGLVQEGAVDSDVMKDLSMLPAEYGVRALSEFRDSKNLSKIVNKNSMLAGIIRTIRKDISRGKLTTSSSNATSKAANTPLAAEEVMVADDDMEGDESSSVTHDRNLVDLLTGCPVAQDNLLYAVPVCAPYISMQRFKYKMKLTPGTLKRGKAAKQAMELLTKMKFANEVERAQLKNVSDAEVLAAMIGEVKLAAPGLHQAKAKKQRGQK